MHPRNQYLEGQRATQRASEAEAMAQTMVANGAGMNPSESPYSEGDKVIIPQQSLVYEAKVGSENERRREIWTTGSSGETRTPPTRLRRVSLTLRARP